MNAVVSPPDLHHSAHRQKPTSWGGTAVAPESIGNWYWIVDEIEEAGFTPLLVHLRKAKFMMGLINKDREA